MLASMMNPPGAAESVTPDDDNDLDNVATGLYIGGAGNVRVAMAGDTTNPVTFTGLLAGVIYPMRVSRVYSTGTTATNIVAVRN